MGPHEKKWKQTITLHKSRNIESAWWIDKIWEIVRQIVWTLMFNPPSWQVIISHKYNWNKKTPWTLLPKLDLGGSLRSFAWHELIYAPKRHCKSQIFSQFNCSDLSSWWFFLTFWGFETQQSTCLKRATTQTAWVSMGYIDVSIPAWGLKNI